MYSLPVFTPLRSINRSLRQNYRHKNRLAIMLISGMFFSAGTTAAALKWSRPSHGTTISYGDGPRISNPDRVTHDLRDAEFLPVQLKWSGFVPGEITRPAGHYFLAVNNV